MVIVVPILADFLELLTPKYHFFDHLLQVYLRIYGGMLVFVIFCFLRPAPLPLFLRV
jgi:hypothetical protein